jgi:hypothetical protein
MTILNNSSLLILPFILLFSIPLAIFATITSTLATSVLLFRVLLVYAELAFAVIPYYILGVTTTKPIIPQTTSFLNSSSLPARRPKHRSSGGSPTSGGSLTPVAGDINLGLNQSTGPQRDFEGVGGWRLDAPSEDDPIWTNVNSRLELPADHVRRHRRSLTSGSTFGDCGWRGTGRSYSPEATVILPNSSRARTPPTTAFAGIAWDGYFPALPGVTKLSKKASSVMTAASGSSASSKGSGGLTLK